jgi:hypothetical protein
LSISLLPRVTSVEENFGLFILLLSSHPTRFSSVAVLLLPSQLTMRYTDALLLFSHDVINADLTHTISFVNKFLFNNRVLNTFIILILSLLIQINFFFILNFLIHFRRSFICSTPSYVCSHLSFPCESHQSNSSVKAPLPTSSQLNCQNFNDLCELRIIKLSLIKYRFII